MISEKFVNIFADEEEIKKPKESQIEAALSQLRQNLIAGSSGSKDLQIIPRVAAILHILEEGFEVEEAVGPINKKISVETLRKAEEIVMISKGHKQIFIEVIRNMQKY